MKLNIYNNQVNSCHGHGSKGRGTDIMSLWVGMEKYYSNSDSFLTIKSPSLDFLLPKRPFQVAKQSPTKVKKK